MHGYLFYIWSSTKMKNLCISSMFFAVSSKFYIFVRKVPQNHDLLICLKRNYYTLF